MVRNGAGSAVLGLGLLVALAGAATAGEDTRAFSLAPRELTLCASRDGGQPEPVCADGQVRQLVLKVDAALRAALAVVSPRTAPLLLRNQSWLDEVSENGEERTGDDGEQPTFLAGLLEQRVAMLEGVKAGAGRRDLQGAWSNAFADAVLKPGERGSLMLDLSQHRAYGGSEAKGEGCQATVHMSAAAGGWLKGQLETGEDNGEKAILKVAARLQGETLRIVLTRIPRDGVLAAAGCGIDQMTGTYFAVGSGSGATGPRPAAPFTAPSFDCTRPETMDQEEICADPELAETDVRLNTAWSRLLPRLDATTKRHLVADQRRYVVAQAQQYPQFLHPAWAKRTYSFHDLGGARDELHHLQRERIALLEGFDDSRRGLEGLWLASDALLRVERDGSGTVTATGWKWFQGDWKAGCDYEMKGRMRDGRFVSDERRKNPDTLERDHATLIVNGLDDTYAKHRSSGDGEASSPDEQKCKRSQWVSSTSRLFPVRPPRRSTGAARYAEVDAPAHVDTHRDTGG